MIIPWQVTNARAAAWERLAEAQEQMRDIDGAIIAYERSVILKRDTYLNQSFSSEIHISIRHSQARYRSQSVILNRDRHLNLYRAWLGRDAHFVCAGCSSSSRHHRLS